MTTWMGKYSAGTTTSAVGPGGAQDNIGGGEAGGNGSNKQNAWYEAISASDENVSILIRARTIRSAMFDTLFHIAHGDSSNSHQFGSYMFAFLTLVCFLQQLDFPLRGDLWGVDKKSLEWLYTATSILTLRYHETYHHYGVIIAAIALVWLAFVLIIISHFTIKSDTFHEQRVLRVILRYYFPLFTTILFIPICTVFLESFRCTYDPAVYTTGSGGGVILVDNGRRPWSAINQECFGVEHIVWLVVNIPTLLLYFNLAVVVLIAHAEHNAIAPVLVSGPHSRADISRFVIWFILVAILGPLSHAPTSSPLLLTILLVIGMGCLLWSRWYLLPYYRFNLCLLTVAEAAVLFWVSLLALVIAATETEASRNLFGTLNAHTTGASVGILWTMPLVVGAAVLMTYVRKWDLVALSVEDITSPYVLELHARFRMEHVQHALRSPSYLLSRDITAVEYQSVIKTCEDAYRQALIRQKRSSLVYQLYAQFVFEFRGNLHCAHRFAVWARDHSSMPDIQFLASRLINLVDLQYQRRTENNEILSYIAFEHHMLLASKHDAAASLAQLNFWGLLARPKPDVAQLDRLAVNIASHNRHAFSSYKKMIELNPHSPQALRLYASFLLDVRQDKTAAQQQLEQATYADAKKHLGEGFNTIRGSNESMAVFDERNAIIVISGDDIDLGIILKTNARKCTM